MEFRDIKKILFLRYDGKIGDYIVTSWIYREIKRQRPDVQIDVVGISKNESLFSNNKNISNFYKLKKSKKIYMYFLAKKLRKENYDIIIDPTELLRNRDLFFIKNIAAKINFGYNKSNIPLFNKNIDKNSKTMLEVYKEILENLVIEINDKNLVYYNKSKTIFDSISIIKRVELVISPDTSIVHIAEGLNKRIITFYTSSDNDFAKWKIRDGNNQVIRCCDVNEVNFNQENLKLN